MSRRKIVYLLFSLVVTVSIFWYLLQHVSPGDVLQILRDVDRGALAMFVVLSLSMSGFRTWRYLLLLEISGYRPGRLALYLIVLVRNLFSDLLPARIGTLVYIYLVNSRLGVPFGAAASSFALAFLFDFIVVVPLVLLAGWIAQAAHQIEGSVLLIGGGVLGGISIMLLLFLPHMIGLCIKILEGRQSTLMEKLRTMLSSTRDELLAVSQSGVYGRVLFLSLLVRVTKYSSFYFFLYALLKPLDFSITDLHVAKCFLGIFSAEFAASLPISGIGGFGAYEGAWALTFSLLGFPSDIASLTAISHHLFTQVYGYGLGVAALLVLLLPYFRTDKDIQVRKTKKREGWFSFYGRGILVSGVISLILILIAQIPLQSAKSEIQKRSGDPMSAEDRKRRKALHARLQAEIVFDSNRSGTFGIYRMNLDGSELSTVYDTKWHEMFPDPSPDGTRIVFGRHRTLSKNAPGEVWIADRDGKNARRLVENGTFPTFSTDGKNIYFERRRKKVLRIDLEGQNETLIFPVRGTGFRKYQVVKPKMSPDAKRVAFTSDRGGRWNAWYADLETNEVNHIGKGCEPDFYRGGERIAWINRYQTQAAAGIAAQNLKGKDFEFLQDAGPPRGHEYFPSFSDDGKYLLYSDCPADEHSHEDANYQLFLRDLERERPVRLTFDGYTNRWPKLLPLEQESLN